jgi:hypothetical protein
MLLLSDHLSLFLLLLLEELHLLPKQKAPSKGAPALGLSSNALQKKTGQDAQIKIGKLSCLP